MSNTYLKIFFSQIFLNEARCRIVDEPPKLPNEFDSILQRPEEPPLTNIESDRYLFESAETTEEKIIVTTDTKLIKHFENNDHFQLWNTHDFFNHHNII